MNTERRTLLPVLGEDESTAYRAGAYSLVALFVVGAIAAQIWILLPVIALVVCFAG